MALSHNKNSNTSFLMLLGLFAVFMLSLYFLNMTGALNLGTKASFSKSFPKVTLKPVGSPSPKVNYGKPSPKTVPNVDYPLNK